VRRNKFLYNKTNQLDALILQIYFGMEIYMFRTVPLSIIGSLFTAHSAIVYVIQVCRQLSSRTKMEILEFHPGPARKLSTNLYDLYHCWVYSEWNPDDGQTNCPKDVEFRAKINLWN
jgi:hypothetical protein